MSMYLVPVEVFCVINAILAHVVNCCELFALVKFSFLSFLFFFLGFL